MRVELVAILPHLTSAIAPLVIIRLAKIAAEFFATNPPRPISLIVLSLKIRLPIGPAELVASPPHLPSLTVLSVQIRLYPEEEFFVITPLHRLLLIVQLREIQLPLLKIQPICAVVELIAMSPPLPLSLTVLLQKIRASMVVEYIVRTFPRQLSKIVLLLKI